MRIFRSMLHAWAGIYYAFTSQPNFKIHVLGVLFMLLSAAYFQFELWELICCLLAAGLVVAAELLNTAIESVVDLHSKEYTLLAKRAKDCAAGAVLILALLALTIWILFVGSKTGIL